MFVFFDPTDFELIFSSDWGREGCVKQLVKYPTQENSGSCFSEKSITVFIDPKHNTDSDV